MRVAPPRTHRLVLTSPGLDQTGGYKDYQDYGVMFPSHIVQKIDGRVVADRTVTQALANPYLIFPPPKELQK
jgi:hypothetical protein